MVLSDVLLLERNAILIYGCVPSGSRGCILPERHKYRAIYCTLKNKLCYYHFLFYIFFEKIQFCKIFKTTVESEFFAAKYVRNLSGRQAQDFLIGKFPLP